jgi:tyrosine-protein kinase Etk/Wzc
MSSEEDHTTGTAPDAHLAPGLGGSLTDLALVLARHWRMVGLVTLAGTAIMLVVSLVLPKWYEAKVSMMAPKRSAMQTMMFPQNAGALAAMDLLSFMGGGTEPNVLADILQCRTVTDAVIKKYDLQKRYDKKTIEETRKTLWRHARVDVERKSSVITLRVEDWSPEVARDMAATIADEANRLNNRISAVRAGQERRFLAARLVESKQDLERAEVALRDFSTKHKILDLKEQTKASIEAVARIRGEIMARDVMLSYVNSFAGEGEANKQRLRREVAELRRQLARLEEGSAAAGGAAVIHKDGSGSVVTPIAELPELALEYVRRYRDLKIQETIFELLTKQHELAKLAEASDTANAQIIDEPVAATYKVRPKRAYYVIFGFLVSFLVAFAVARFRDSLAANPAKAARWHAVREALRSRPRGRG